MVLSCPGGSQNSSFVKPARFQREDGTEMKFSSGATRGGVVSFPLTAATSRGAPEAPSLPSAGLVSSNLSKQNGLDV